MRSYLSEFLGAFFLVFTALSGAAGSPPALAALTTGSVLVACAWFGAHISGAHFNPAVSLAVYLRGGLSLQDLWSYWAAQLGGAVVAALASLGAVAPPGGGLDVARGGALAPALAVEFLFTFLLVTVVLAIGVSRRQERNVVYALVVGLVVLAGVLSVSRVSGAAFNPAVAFAMSVHGDFDWRAIWVYGSAELLGAVAAVALVAQSRPLRHPAQERSVSQRSD